MSYGAHFTSLTATVVMMLVIMQSTKQLLHSAYKVAARMQAKITWVVFKVPACLQAPDMHDAV